jgi:hypothetical protein
MLEGCLQPNAVLEIVESYTLTVYSWWATNCRDQDPVVPIHIRVAVKVGHIIQQEQRTAAH